MSKYIKVVSVRAGTIKKEKVPQSTADRIYQLRKMLGMNLKEESFKESVRRDMRALNNNNLQLNF